ncbi:hypothetical protein GT347_25205 [Xylophilus rhododendri]|uniref:Surface-adhesin protein E-like domain-containing protein n=1 Tax=Xylophilus rhododendri TaxID=2697032 RepID=A0A857JBD7_9BURK|nr:surface-adhesin E family protein [Xylophilus rhododendri]QHJ00998.1 hypothetical protein GT347_25205 [Xylophilus rhododendri]
MSARILAFLLLFGSCGLAQAVEWFTLIGDKNDPAVDTAQLDSSTLVRKGDRLMLRFRVNLAQARKLDGGEVYQSYVSHITVDCASQSVFHDSQERFPEPFWQGESRTETFVQPKPMAFGGLSPDPKRRILNAACGPRSRH